MTVRDESESPTKMLNRIATILDAFDRCDQLTLAEVSAYTGLPRSSAHRLLDSLVKLHWLRREGRKYELGLRMIELGRLASQSPVRRAARPHLHELHRLTGHVVHLGVLTGADVTLLEEIPKGADYFVAARVRDRLPAHRTAIGKVLLSFAIPDVTTHGYVRTGEVMPTLPPELTRGQISEIRRAGFAYDFGELAIGNGCVAVPVLVTGIRPCAVAVSGPMSRFKIDQTLVSNVRATARMIQGALAESVGRSPARLRGHC
ncbi:IclR family transcriptional regulator [Nocardia sp. NPDC004123]